MCRNIRPLHNFAPAATPDEVRAAAQQYVRKVAAAGKPSRANEATSTVRWMRWPGPRNGCWTHW